MSIKHIKQLTYNMYMRICIIYVMFIYIQNILQNILNMYAYVNIYIYMGIYIITCPGVVWSERWVNSTPHA